jgi:hypothetical protein
MILSARRKHTGAGSASLTSEAARIDENDLTARLGQEPCDRTANQAGPNYQHIVIGAQS